MRVGELYAADHCSLYLSLHIGNLLNFMKNNDLITIRCRQFPGTIYKGGVVVPIILILSLHRHSIERYLAIRSAFGRGSLVKFVANIKSALAVAS